MLVEEQRLFRAAVEHERIAPLQSRDDAALARFFDEQHRERILRHVALGWRARENPLGIRPRPSQRRLDRTVVHDDVRFGEQPDAARRHEPRISRARTDQIDTTCGCVQWAFVGPK